MSLACCNIWKSVVLSKQNYRVSGQSDGNPKSEEVTHNFLEKPNIFAIVAIFNFFKDHSSLIDHRKTGIYNDSEISICYNEQNWSQAIGYVKQYRLEILSPILSWKPSEQNHAKNADEHDLEKIEHVRYRFPWEMPKPSRKQDSKHSAYSWSIKFWVNFLCCLFRDFFVELWRFFENP